MNKRQMENAFALTSASTTTSLGKRCNINHRPEKPTIAMITSMFRRAILSLIFWGLLWLTAGCGEDLSLGSAGAESDSKQNYTLRQQLEEMQGRGDAIEVPVIQLAPGAITEELTITGELVPKKAVIVYPLMAGRITFLRPIKVGDIVAEGEVVAKIDDRNIEDDIRRQEDQIKILGERIKLDNEELAQSQKDLEFDKQLVKEGFLNQNVYEKTELAVKRAQMALHQSELTLEQERNRLQTLLREREKVPITATIAGMVVMPSHLTAEKKSFDLLNEEILSLDNTLVSSSTPIFGIVSQEGYLAQCLVNGKDKAKLEVGQRARLSVISHKAVEVGGEVARIALLQEADSHAYKVWLNLDTMDPSFNSGLFTRANIALAERSGTIVVKKEYVKERNNQDFVQTVVGGLVRDVHVTRGIEQGEEVELVEGVKAGDLLIASKEVFMADQAVTPVAVIEAGAE